ncbi:MAG TPA: hypothetical protein VFQ52_00995, partial [Rhizomicrobium sp.]|nr:hypothetical protein [Rhizomicrobium sp.]
MGGLLELHVAQGGSIIGETGASLTVDKLFNEGVIRLPGGTITQQQILPVLYTGADALGVRALSDAFAVNADGSIDENAASLVTGLTNAQLAGSGSPSGPQHPIYLLGLLDADQGLVFAPGSVTDLSGTSIRNPYATDGADGRLIDTGRVVAGGTIQALPDAALPGQLLFQPTASSAYFSLQALGASTHGAVPVTHLDVGQEGLQLIAAPGSLIDLSGASDIYDQPVAGAAGGLAGSHYASSPVWSDAGTLKAGAGATLTGANLMLRGGAPQARGGTLELLDPMLSQHDPDAPAVNVVSADMLAASGIDTLIADGSIDSIGDVNVSLARGFFLQDRPFVNDASVQNDTSTPNGLVPAIRSHGGMLEINAPYIGFSSKFDALSTPAIGTPGTGSVDFEAGAIDFTGVLLVDQSVGSASFGASGDIRMTGVVPWQQTFLAG